MKRPLRTVLFGGLATDNLHLLIFGQLIMLLPGLWRLLRHPWPGHWLEKFFWLFALLAVGLLGGVTGLAWAEYRRRPSRRAFWRVPFHLLNTIKE